ncbi:MAG: YIP1 family protein [Gammaproteobacteria bacterium]|nr:YIP1 family protein [Gammaproteobacteria bacterium]
MSEEQPSETIRPLHDVWLRPRRVFRELADRPIGRTDYLLGCVQGIVSWLAFSRAQSAGSGEHVAAILGTALIAGPIAGVLGLYLMSTVYMRLGRAVGGIATRNQVFHVLAYSGVPMVTSLMVWLATAAIVGAPTFIQPPRGDLEPFLALLLRLQFLSHALLVGWTLLLQVMGFSEVERLATVRAFGIWVLGQALVMLAILMIWILILGLSGVKPPTG